MILLTGATGYVGGRLARQLVEAGRKVRVLVRDPARLADRPWVQHVEIAVGDLLDPESLRPALEGCESAYYLVHSMGYGPDFSAMDRTAARNFVAAAPPGLKTIYLGGLLPRASASQHLASRAEVGRVLAEGLPTTEFRAGPIVGSGSASFEMVRYLTERLPVMVTPRWVDNRVDPIGIADVLAYLMAALDREALGVVDIGCQALTFREMMLTYASVRGLRRVILPVPILAPALAARWVGFITPIPNSLAVPLVQGMVVPLEADTRRAQAEFPEIHPIPYREAVERALARVDGGKVETRWSTALGAYPRFHYEDREGLLREVRSGYAQVPPERVFAVVTSLGGDTGWLCWNWAWQVRGLLDRLLGGAGLRRGRRHPTELAVGEALDFWRVEALEPGRLLRLRAEMKVPGRAWLEFQTRPEGAGTRLLQTAIFEPRGLSGWVYWYALWPIHSLIFSDLVEAVLRRAGAPAPAGPG